MAGEPEFDDLLTAAALFQEVVPGAVLVGGTAAAVHARHRVSSDTDHTIPDLRDRFETLLATLEQRDDWRTARVMPPVVILGQFHGVETTLRQLRRSRPLETVEIPVGTVRLRVPTLAEMIRIKGWLALTRNMFRDYLDLAALTAAAGEAASVHALAGFDACYQDVDTKGAARATSPLTQLARQLAEPKPADLARIGEVARYKGIVPRWDSWEKIEAQCRLAATWAVAALLPAAGPQSGRSGKGKRGKRGPGEGQG